MSSPVQKLIRSPFLTTCTFQLTYSPLAQTSLMVGPWPLRLHIIGADLSRTTNSSPEEGYSTFFWQKLFWKKWGEARSGYKNISFASLQLPSFSCLSELWYWSQSEDEKRMAWRSITWPCFKAAAASPVESQGRRSLTRLPLHSLFLVSQRDSIAFWRIETQFHRSNSSREKWIDGGWALISKDVPALYGASKQWVSNLSQR